MLCANENADEQSPDALVAYEQVVLHLLGQSHTLAWQAAQRTLLELVRTGDADAAVVGGLSGDAEVALRTCAVLAVVGDQQRTSLFAEPLSDLCLAPRLDLRQAAAIALRAIGQQIPADAPTRGLPPGLRFELPQRHDSHAALDPLEQTLGLWRPQLHTLADLSGVDVDALYERVLLHARRVMDPEAEGDRVPTKDHAFGWGAVAPSAQAIRAALAELTAELVDAGRVGVGGALRAADLYPVMEVALLRNRPERRSAAVRTFIALAARAALYRHTLAEIAEHASDRLAPVRRLGALSLRVAATADGRPVRPRD